MLLKYVYIKVSFIKMSSSVGFWILLYCFVQCICCISLLTCAIKYITESSMSFLEKRKAFDKHRKEHYNEALNIKLARELIAKELAELEDDGEPVTTTFAESASSTDSSDQQVR